MLIIGGFIVGIGNFNISDGVQTKEKIVEITPSPQMCNMSIENEDGTITYTYTKSDNTSNGLENAEELYTTTCPEGLEPDKGITDKYDKLFVGEQ